jgi:uncharacterized membrane protein
MGPIHEVKLHMEADSLPEARPNRHPIHRILVLVCALIVAGYVLFSPLSPLAKSTLIGYSVCHQIPDHSFHLGEAQLPLCARCTGTYIGVAVAFAAMALLGRWRTGEMLPVAMIVVLVLFIGVMGIDGINSYATLLGSAPLLYTPQNWLRAATGSLNGIALALIVFPVFNFTLWKNPQPRPPLVNAWELLGIALAGAAVVFAVQAEPPWLLYPMALVSMLGVLWMLTLVNTMILLILFRWEGQAETWRDAAPLLLFGLTIALLELTLLGTVRYAVTGVMGWPTSV